MARKKKNKNKQKPYDKLTFEKREKLREKKRKERVYTKNFRTIQSFGAASEVRHIPPEEYSSIIDNLNKDIKQ